MRKTPKAEPKRDAVLVAERRLAIPLRLAVPPRRVVLIRVAVPIGVPAGREVAQQRGGAVGQVGAHLEIELRPEVGKGAIELLQERERGTEYPLAVGPQKAEQRSE